LLYPGQRLFFKPRFVFDGNRLAVLPPPVQSAADFQRLLDHPDQVLTSDAFLDRPRRMFPFTLSLLRWMASDFHVGATLHGAPRHPGVLLTRTSIGSVRDHGGDADDIRSNQATA
jgi:hypothetical protein